MVDKFYWHNLLLLGSYFSVSHCHTHVGSFTEQVLCISTVFKKKILSGQRHSI